MQSSSWAGGQPGLDRASSRNAGRPCTPAATSDLPPSAICAALRGCCARHLRRLAAASPTALMKTQCRWKSMTAELYFLPGPSPLLRMIAQGQHFQRMSCYAPQRLKSSTKAEVSKHVKSDDRRCQATVTAPVTSSDQVPVHALLPRQQLR